MYFSYSWKATGQEDINLEIRRRKFRYLMALYGACCRSHEHE
jgi:hypothetical protein